MKTHQVAVLETVSAVQTFLDEKKADIAPINESGARHLLDDLAVQMTAQSLDQEAGQNSSVGETARQTKLRRELREEHMAPISAVVKTVLPQAPELTAYAVPSARASTMRLIATAGVMADAAKADEAVLIAGGLPPDFVDQLRAATAALKTSLDTRAQHGSQSRGATVAMKPLVQRAIATLRVLDSIMTRKLKFNDRLLAEWKKVKRIRKKTGPAQGSSTKTGESDGTPVTPIVPVTPAAPAVQSTSTAPAA